MSFIAENPLIIPEVESVLSAPRQGTRGVFASSDGWYDIDSSNNIKKFAMGDEAIKHIICDSTNKSDEIIDALTEPGVYCIKVNESGYKGETSDKYTIQNTIYVIVTRYDYNATQNSVKLEYADCRQIKFHSESTTMRHGSCNTSGTAYEWSSWWSVEGEFAKIYQEIIPTPEQILLFVDTSDLPADNAEWYDDGDAKYPKPGQGENGTALEFKGQSSIKIENPLKYIPNYTISFKMKTSQTGRDVGGNWYQGIGVLDGDVGGYQRDFGFAMMADGCLKYGEGEQGQTSSRHLATKRAINDGKWHKITLVRDNGIASLYVDDEIHDVAPCFTSTRTDAQYLTIGSQNTEKHECRYYEGLIDDIRFYDGAISPIKGLKTEIDSSKRYDYIINTQADFDAMRVSTTWRGATRILFNTDITINFASDNDGIVIPPTVKHIDGNGHIIYCYSTYGSWSFSLFKSNEKRKDLSIDSLNFLWNIDTSNPAYMFNNLSNIYDVNIKVSLWGYPSSIPISAIFYSCDNLTDVYVDAPCTYWYSHSAVAVYQNCNNLMNCYGYMSGCDNISIYQSCKNLVNCEGYASDKGYNGSTDNEFTYYTSCYSFYSCENLANCKGTVEALDTRASGAVFASCKNIANCVANTAIIATTTANINIKGFNSCSYISNARKGTFSGTLWSGTTTKRDDNSCDL